MAPTKSDHAPRAVATAARSRGYEPAQEVLRAIELVDADDERIRIYVTGPSAEAVVSLVLDAMLRRPGGGLALQRSGPMGARVGLEVKR